MEFERFFQQAYTNYLLSLIYSYYFICFWCCYKFNVKNSINKWTSKRRHHTNTQFVTSTKSGGKGD